jgi:hypothetical protein
MAYAQSTIYTDALGAGWQSWSWNSTINFANPTPVYTGSQSIAVSSTAWGALSLYHPAVTAANYATLEFYIHGGAAGGQDINLLIENDDAGQSSGPVPIGTTNLVAGAWRKLAIPLTAFGLATPTFTRIDWQDATGAGVATYYLDDIRLVAAGAAAPLLRGGRPTGTREATAYFDQPMDAAALGSGVYELHNPADTNYASRVAGSFVRYDAARYAVTAAFPADFGTNGTYTCWLRNISGTNGLPIATNTSFTFALREVHVGLDAASGLQPISPYIYGMAFAPNSAYIAGAGITVNRWGGNHSSRYNWEAGAANRDFDWYFENFDWDGEDGSAIAFITRNARGGAASLISVPSLPWVARDTTSYSFSVAKYGPQQSVNPYNNDKGNGLTPGGQRVTNDVTDASVPSRPQPRAGDPTNAVYQSEWLLAIAAQFRSVTPNVLPFLAIDNEPELWGDTHRDVHPAPATYDELYEQFTNYASMVRTYAPGALIFGPVSSGWWFYWNSQAEWADKSAHGEKDFIPWWLEKLRSNDVATGSALIDVLDIHFYPTDVFNEDVTEATRAKRLRSTRAFWDASYIDEGWIGVDHWATYSQPNSNAVMLIPRFRALVSNYYPGLKLALTEWNMGAESDMSAGLAVADALGIFGREQLWLATYWSNPSSNSPVYEAFKLFGNSDGAGRAFEGRSVNLVAGGTNLFGAYAARSDDASRLTVVLVNKSPSNDLLVRLALTNFLPSGTAAVYQLTSLTGRVEPESSLTNVGTTIDVNVGRYSAAFLDFRAVPADADADGLSDAFELLYPAAADPTGDADGDGVSNRAERDAKTDPTDTLSVLRVSLAMNATNWLASWPSSRGRTNLLERSASVTGGWSVVAAPAGAGGVLFEQGELAPSNQVFRIRAE